MKGLRSILAAFCLGLLTVLSGCSGGDNETPASFDPIELALVRVEPADGESAVPRNRVVRLIFNTTVLPASVNDQSLQLRTGGTFQTRPEGQMLINGNVVEFDPRVTATGGPNAIGFDAGAQILLNVPLFEAASGEPANNFLQNIEGNPLTLASGDNNITFTTGSTWDDPKPGPPGVLRVEFTPSPNAQGLIASNAAVTVVFDEPVDPGSLILSQNIFLTNNTDTSPLFQQDIPSVTFFDGSLTRYTFLPVFGFGQGPFNIQMNFIDPDAPDTFSPDTLPRDLAGNQVQNFTFVDTFDTVFDPNAVNTGLLREDFTTVVQRDAPNTDAIWSDDAEVPFSLIGQPITTRIQNVNIAAIITLGGASTAIDNVLPPCAAPPGCPTGQVVNGGLQVIPGEEDYCPTADPLVGPDLLLPASNPPTADGRRKLNLYRAAELAGNGTIIRIAWGPDSDATFAATYPGLIARLGHKREDTSLAPGGFFQQFDVDGFVKVVDGVSYNVPQSAEVNGGMLNDGFVNYPSLTTFFDYDGENDLLLDVSAQEGNTFQTHRTFLAVTQLPGGQTCNCVTIFNGQCNLNNSAGQRQGVTTYLSDTYNPPGSPAVANPSPFVDVMQFELAKLRSDARSRYYNTLSDSPDYLAPIINPLVQPGGSTIALTWSGSADGVIEDVPFTPNINAIDGFRHIRFNVVLRSNIFTGARSRIVLLEIPFTFE